MTSATAPNTLTHYTRRACGMLDDHLLGAIADVRETLTIWRDEDPVRNPYVAKLWAEFDAYTTEMQQRRAGKVRRLIAA